MKTGVPSYWYGGHGANYLSPFFSPEFLGRVAACVSASCRRGGRAGLPFSPAFLDLVDSGRFPIHLLLLPRRLLQGILGGPDQLRRGRAAQEIISASGISR